MGDGGRCRVSGECYALHVAYISKARQAELVRDGCHLIAPDLVVEADSPKPMSRRATAAAGV
ncbi:MAG: hypothetical protein IT324_33860 [Anaerolineae bacterium]|nr:hypothetical protein [Anaerolineae bacterium]